MVAKSPLTSEHVTSSRTHHHCCDDGSHHHSHDLIPRLRRSDNQALRGMLIALLLNTIFLIIEFIGAEIYSSVAIFADAIHDVGDTFVLALSAFFIVLARLPSIKQFTYGLPRLSLLGGGITALFLISGSVFSLFNAAWRLYEPISPVASGMVGMAILGIVVNSAGYWSINRSSTSISGKIISLHLVEDLLGWIAILVGALVMLLVHAPIIDPLLSIAISLFVLWHAAKRGSTIAKLFLEGVPEGIDEQLIENAIKAVPNVSGIHDTHIWSLDGELHLMTCHVVVSKGITLDSAIATKDKIRTLLEQHNIWHCTIELEMEGFNCKASELHM
jgi:cobalt-zinc-cadmium efflux system protein